MGEQRKVRIDGKEAGYAEALPPGGGTEDPLIAFIAHLMDNAIRVPGTRWRVGLDPLLGLIPGVGDGTGALVSVALIGASVRYGVPKVVLVRMALNVMLNTVIGVIPGVGDVFSAWFKSNALNYRLLQKHGGARRASTLGDWLFVGGLIASILLVAVLALYGAYRVVRGLVG